jgi:hypothetical protein
MSQRINPGAGRAIAVAAAVFAQCAVTVVAAGAATLQNTGISLTNAIHKGGQLVITGKTNKAGQVVVLDDPKRTATSKSDRSFRINAPLVHGDCVIKLSVKTKTDEVKVAACGLNGPKGDAGAAGASGMLSVATTPVNAGFSTPLPDTNGAFAWLGAPVTVSITNSAKQRVLLAGTAMMGTTLAAASAHFNYCTAAVGGAPSSQSASLIVTFPQDAVLPYSFSTIITLPTNLNWDVGLCYMAGDDVIDLGGVVSVSTALIEVP